MPDIFEIQRTENFCEFEMKTDKKTYTLQADTEVDTMKWVNQLCGHVGVQDFIYEEELEDLKKLERVSTVDVCNELPPQLSGGGGGGGGDSTATSSSSSLPSDACVSHTLSLFSSERIYLRDVLTSVLNPREPIRPYVIRLSPLYNRKNAISVSVEFIADDNRRIPVKSAYFDRFVGDVPTGVLCYIELETSTKSDATVMTQPGLWLFLRLVYKNAEGGLDLFTQKGTAFAIHDSYCKNCRLSRYCDNSSKAVTFRKTGIDVNLFPQFDTDEFPVYFHVLMLHAIRVGVLTRGFHVRHVDPIKVVSDDSTKIIRRASLPSVGLSIPKLEIPQRISPLVEKENGGVAKVRTCGGGFPPTFYLFYYFSFLFFISFSFSFSIFSLIPFFYSPPPYSHSPHSRCRLLRISKLQRLPFSLPN